jgi:hypothetical protein
MRFLRILPAVCPRICVILELDAEHRVGEEYHAAAHLEQFFLAKNTSVRRVIGYVEEAPP